MSEPDRFSAEINIHSHGQRSGKAPTRCFGANLRMVKVNDDFPVRKTTTGPINQKWSGLPTVDHFHQSLFHVQTQSQSTLMGKFKICSGISHRQREHDGPSLVEIVAQRSQIGEKRLA
jgi:hypothetical protein